MTVILKNNAVSTLTTPISASDTGIVVASGAQFPALAGGDYFYATLVSPAGTTEIVKVTARVGNSMTVVRAQDGSSAASFTAGSLVEMRVNAASIRELRDEASEVNIADTGGYYTATSVEGALAELAQDTLSRLDVSALLADVTLSYSNVTAGDVVRTRAEGFSYEVAASGATDQHVTTAGGVKLYAQPDQNGNFAVKAFGAVGDGVTDDRTPIYTAIDAQGALGGGMVQFEPGLTYAIGRVFVAGRRGYLSLPSGVGLDLNGATLQRIGTNYTDPFIENKNGTGPTSGHTIRNGTIRGTGAAGQVSDQGSGVTMINATKVVIENIKTENTNGDGLLLARTEAVLRNVEIGDFGRNGISPTAGSFVYDNVRITGSPITGANPGLDFDAENDSALESATHVILHIECKNMTFVDFYTAAAGTFAQNIYFHSGKVGPGFNAFRLIASNAVTAGQVYIGPNVEIISGFNNGGAVEIDDVSGVNFYGTRILKDPAATSTHRGFFIEGTVSDLNISGVYCDPALTFGIEQTGTLTNSRFAGCKLGSTYMRGGSGNKFVACEIATLTVADVAYTGNSYELGTRITTRAVAGTGDLSLQTFNATDLTLEIRETATSAPAVLNFRGRNLFSAQQHGSIRGFPDNATWNVAGSEIILGQPGSVDTGDLRFLTSNGGARTERLRIQENGATRPGADNTLSLGTASFRWSELFAGTTVINTSDEREKEQIEAIPDAWLDAWGDVQWSRFKFRDAVAEKADGARWHVGLIAQRIQEVFAARGLDAFQIGLLCHDAWGAETRPVYATRENPETGETEEYDTGEVEFVTPAGDRFGVRYNEAQALEAAWLRREIERMKGGLA